MSEARINLVAMISDEVVFDQPCKYGMRVDCHAVYCENWHTPDMPRKCRRSWYTGGKVRDEDCAGYEKNEAPK